MTARSKTRPLGRKVLVRPAKSLLRRAPAAAARPSFASHVRSNLKST